MPLYEFLCPDGHLTTKFRSVSKLKETVRCDFRSPLCRKKARLQVSLPGKVSGKLIWMGSEVHGNKVNSDEVRQDLEDACLKEDAVVIPKETKEAIEKTRLGVNRKAAGFAS